MIDLDINMNEDCTVKTPFHLRRKTSVTEQGCNTRNHSFLISDYLCVYVSSGLHVYRGIFKLLIKKKIRLNL